MTAAPPLADWTALEFGEYSGDEGFGVAPLARVVGPLAAAHWDSWPRFPLVPSPPPPRDLFPGSAMTFDVFVGEQGEVGHRGDPARGQFGHTATGGGP